MLGACFKLRHAVVSSRSPGLVPLRNGHDLFLLLFLSVAVFVFLRLLGPSISSFSSSDGSSPKYIFFFLAPPGHSIFLVIYAIFTRTIQLGTWDGYVSIYNPYIVKLFRRVVVTRPMMLPRSNNVQARQILYARRAGWLDGEAGSVFPELDSPDGTVKYKSASQDRAY